MKPAYKRRVREENDTSDISTESQHLREHVDISSCKDADVVAAVEHLDYTSLDAVAAKLQSAATRVCDVANTRFASSIADNPTPEDINKLYRRSLKLIKAHEHDVDTATPLDPGRVIRDITATFTLGLTSQTAQTLTFRCVNDAEEGTDTIDTYMDWCTSEYRPAEQVEHAARPSTSAADEPVDVPDQQQPEQQPDAAAADQPAAAENPAPMDTAGFTAAPALPAAPAPATLPGPPRRGLTPSRSLGNLQHSSGGSGAQPVPLFMLEMEAEETVTLLSRRYNTVEWHKPAFEELRRKAGLADVDRQPVMHFVRQLGLLVLELVAAELGDVDERGLGLGLSVADFEHLVRPLYG